MKPFNIEIKEQKFHKGLMRMEREYGFAKADRPALDTKAGREKPVRTAAKLIVLRWIAKSEKEVCN